MKTSRSKVRGQSLSSSLRPFTMWGNTETHFRTSSVPQDELTPSCGSRATVISSWLWAVQTGQTVNFDLWRPPEPFVLHLNSLWTPQWLFTALKRGHKEHLRLFVSLIWWILDFCDSVGVVIMWPRHLWHHIYTFYSEGFQSKTQWNSPSTCRKRNQYILITDSLFDPFLKIIKYLLVKTWQQYF